MTTKNFKVRKGLEIGDSISITDAGVISGLTTDNLSQGTTNEYYTDAKVDARITNTKVINTIGYTPEDAANKGQANGYAPLDGSAKIASTYLPSYVDDVLEYANLAALPGTGETGKIYVAQDTNKIYRWSGSAYVEISASPGSTDSVTEGSTNLYFTNTRARGAISASGSLSYDSGTGVISYTTPSSDGITEGSTNLYFTNTRARGAISASGSLSYDSGTGVVSYTTPTTDGISEGSTNLYFTNTRARGAVSASGSLSYDSGTGVFSYTTPNSDGISEGSTNLYFTNTRARGAISVTDSGGDGSLSYDSGTGVITYTGPSAAEVRAHFTGGTGVTITSGSIAIGQAVATTSDVTFGSVSTATLKSNNATTALTLADTTGDATFASRLLSSASKTIRTGPNRTTGFAAITGATSEDILTQGIGASAAPMGGLLVTNSGLATGSTAGRRQGILIRNFGGQEYNGSSTTTPQGVFMGESSRGTVSDPRSLGAGGPLAAFQGFSNAGSDLASGNTPYWTAEKYPTAPAFGILANQTHKGPWGTAAAAAQFTADISGTTLNVTAISSGTLALGHEIKLSTGSNFPTTTNVYQIIAQTSGTTGSTGTYTLNASPGTVASTSMFSTVTTLGSQFFVNVQPQNTPMTTTNRAQSSMSGESIIFRAQSANTAANIFTIATLPTTAYIGVAGVGNGFAQGTNKTLFAVSDQITTANNIFLANGGIIRTGPTSLQLQDTTGALLKSGNLTYRRTYGCFHKIANVTAAAADTAYNFDWTNDTTPHVNNQGITVSNTSRLNFDVGGNYNVVIEMVGKNVDNADRTAYIWLAKNGTDLSETAIKLVLTKDTTTMLAKDWLIDNIAANDYIEVRFAVDTTTSGVSLEYTASQSTPYVRPAVASATITITPVGA